MTTNTPPTAPAPGGQQTTIVIVSAIYLFVLALFNICGNLAMIGLGSIGSQLSGEFAAMGSDTAELANASFLVTIAGIVGLLLGIAALVVAVGLFMRAPWAHNGTIAVNGAYIALVIVGIFTGGSTIISIILMIISGVIIYFFLTNADTRAVFGK